MTWRVALVLVASLGSPALAAGGWDEMDAPLVLVALFLTLLMFGLPCVGLGFFLQALMRLRNAVVLLASGFAILAGCGAAYRGLSRTLELAPAFTVFILIFATLFGLGWRAGIWDANRHAKNQKLA